jgi:glutamate N-acetyltransferase/amino-acid N-acetyltransferase
MLCFIMTDLEIASPLLKSALRDAVEDSFNMLTVDGEQSTSDSALIMANGACGGPELTRGSAGYKRFASALDEICLELASMMARDGEGATKLINVVVNGARSVEQARKAAKAVANSLLVKTAVHGSDPNWGRILPVLGRGRIFMKPEKVDVYFGRVKVASKGLATGNGKKAEKELKKKEVTIRIELYSGRASARAITCDLTEEYVRINSEYTT